MADAAEAVAALEATTTTAVPTAARTVELREYLGPLAVGAVLIAGLVIGAAAGRLGGSPSRGWWAIASLIAAVASLASGWVAASAGPVRDGRAVVIGASGVLAGGVVLLSTLPRTVSGTDAGLSTIGWAPLCLAAGLAVAIGSNHLSRFVSLVARHAQVVLGIAVIPALASVVVAVLDVHPGTEADRTAAGWIGTVVAVLAAVWAAAGSFRAPRLYVAPGLGLAIAAGAGVAATLGTPGSGGAWTAGVMTVVAAGAATGGVLSGYSRGRRVVVAVESIIDWAPDEDIADHLGEAADTLVDAAGFAPGKEVEQTHRVIEHALGIARELDLPPARMRVISLGALFHDVGKIAIPDEVLNKPGELTDSERQIVEQHSLAGYQLASRLNLLWEAALAIRHHHEWVDGSGYPDGLAGEAIPIESRIIAICDMYDALTTERPYRDAMSPEDALVILRAEAGTHLDPDCLAAFERFMRRQSSVVTRLHGD